MNSPFHIWMWFSPAFDLIRTNKWIQRKSEARHFTYLHFPPGSFCVTFRSIVCPKCFKRPHHITCISYIFRWGPTHNYPRSCWALCVSDWIRKTKEDTGHIWLLWGRTGSCLVLQTKALWCHCYVFHFNEWDIKCLVTDWLHIYGGKKHWTLWLNIL